MRVAIPTWNGRVSPVFDVANSVLLVDLEGSQETGRQAVGIVEAHPAARAGRVAGLGVNVLICGAISGPLESLLVAAGVRVIPQTCGAAEEVLRAFVSGQLTDEAFLMPGCRGRRRPRGRRRRLRGRRRGAGRFNM